MFISDIGKGSLYEATPSFVRKSFKIVWWIIKIKLETTAMLAFGSGELLGKVDKQW